MRTRAMEYAGSGLNTRTDVKGSALLFWVVVSVTAVAVYRHSVWRMVFAVAVLGMPVISVWRICRHLEALEREHAEPTETMQLLFRTATMLPMTAYLPYMLLLRLVP